MRIAPNYPVIGADAFRTATGVHAAAVVKAFRKGDRALMDAVYAAVPASLVGRQQEIEVGPMSGRSNVVFWLESRGLPATDEIVDRIFAAAKASNRTLTHEQVREPDWRRCADKTWHSSAADRSSAATRLLTPDTPPRAIPRTYETRSMPVSILLAETDDRTEECQTRMAGLHRRLLPYGADAARPEEPVTPSRETTKIVISFPWRPPQT